jgi:hypothetical protein
LSLDEIPEPTDEDLDQGDEFDIDWADFDAWLDSQTRDDSYDPEEADIY